VSVAKGSAGVDVVLSTEELREIHLALQVRIAQLSSTNTTKMGPNDRAKLQRRIDVCNEANSAVQKARGK
jgi:hypothetical protein